MIKASATVTITCYRDTKSITRYYKLQASTASAPSKPTTNPPSGWDDSEPSYTSESTNTLYFCDLSAFSDGTFSYSTVSKSSSYEAAKEAYNKAQNAQNTANDSLSGLEATTNAMDEITSRMNERIETAEMAIDKINNLISTLVVDANGGSLMEQTADGWIFSMGETLTQIQAAADDLKNLEDELAANNGALDSLEKFVAGLETLPSYIRISTDGDEPCLELGNGSTFKLLITNTAIKFMDGTTVPAYVTNQSLKIGKAEVEDELAFGGFAFAERSNGNMGLCWKGDE